jgi:hypothetical protein
MVLQDDRPNLLHLVRLRFRALALKVDPLLDTDAREDEMAAANPLDKPKPNQESAQFLKPQAGVPASSEYVLERLVALRHAASLASD